MNGIKILTEDALRFADCLLIAVEIQRNECFVIHSHQHPFGSGLKQLHYNRHQLDRSDYIGFKDFCADFAGSSDAAQRNRHLLPESV